MYSSSDLDKISEYIARIIESLFKIQPQKLSETWQKDELLGGKFGLSCRDLVYLFFELEKNFNIKIGEENIANGDFKSIYGISTCIAALIPR